MSCWKIWISLLQAETSKPVNKFRSFSLLSRRVAQSQAQSTAEKHWKTLFENVQDPGQRNTVRNYLDSNKNYSG